MGSFRVERPHFLCPATVTVTSYGFVVSGVGPKLCNDQRGRIAVAEPDVKLQVGAVQRRLIEALDSVVSSGGYREFLEFAAKLPNYSARNTLLIFSQARERGFTPSIVMGYRAWLTRGRHVKRGERGLRICVPVTSKSSGSLGQVEPVLRYFKSATVFDISQTEGEAIPEPLLPCFLEGEADQFLFDFCVAEVEKLGFSVHFGELEGCNGQTNFTDRSVVVARGLPPLQKVKTVLHELAHATMHNRADIEVPTAELEAESSAYLILGTLGIQSEDFSVPYLIRWSKGETKDVEDASLRVSDFVVNFLRRYYDGVFNRVGAEFNPEGKVA